MSRWHFSCVARDPKQPNTETCVSVGIVGEIAAEFLPEGVPIIAQRFNAGEEAIAILGVPEGRLKCGTMNRSSLRDYAYFC